MEEDKKNHPIKSSAGADVRETEFNGVKEIIDKIDNIEKEYKRKMDDLVFDYKKKVQEIIDEEKIAETRNNIIN